MAIVLEAISARLQVTERLEVTTDTDFNQLRPATILVVDDNETNCQLVAGIFAGTHHKVAFCFNGGAALTQTRALKPDLILLDVRICDRGFGTAYPVAPGHCHSD